MTRHLWMIGLLAACGASSPPAVEGAVEGAVEAAAAEADAPDQTASWSHFGSEFTVASALPAATVLGDPEEHATGPVRMAGELTEVCQKAGCWAVVRDDSGNSIRVTMKDHSFGIDKDTRGFDCDVEGQLVRKEVDPERVAHFASEGSRTNPEDGQTEVWELVATAMATRAP